MAQNPDAHEAVNGRQQHIQADNPFLLAALVNEGCDQNGQDHVWQHATHQNEGGQQGGLGLVKDQKADGQIHGLAANGRQDCGDGDAGKILGPKTGPERFRFTRRDLLCVLWKYCTMEQKRRKADLYEKSGLGNQG